MFIDVILFGAKIAICFDLISKIEHCVFNKGLDAHAISMLQINAESSY